MQDDESPLGACPRPESNYERVLLAHGGGGQLTRQLLDTLFVPSFANAALAQRHDGAVLRLGGTRLAFATDGTIVSPLFFPGGDIGSLAVNGTVNDLAMCGARPLWLSTAFIMEEGLPIATLERVVASMRSAARAAGVELVTGDTKVVERGKGDGLYLATAGIGALEHELTIGPAAVRPGDAVLLSGDIGRHGIAIMASREGLEFETVIESDCAPLHEPVLALLARGVRVHCLRDLTRGGMAAALIEIARDGGRDMEIEESAIPIGEAVHGACELLGLDPLHVANEGRFVAIVDAADAKAALDVMRGFEVSAGACRIGRVTEGGGGGDVLAGSEAAGRVLLTGTLGTRRVMMMPSGEQLPRIC